MLKIKQIIIKPNEQLFKVCIHFLGHPVYKKSNMKNTNKPFSLQQHC